MQVFNLVIQGTNGRDLIVVGVGSATASAGFSRLVGVNRTACSIGPITALVGKVDRTGGGIGGEGERLMECEVRGKEMRGRGDE